MESRAGRQNDVRGQSTTRIPSASEWLEIAEQDIKVMQWCYDKGYYGASAYHCQQALEKVVKSMVVKYQLVDNPVRLNHDLMRKLLREWKKKSSSHNKWADNAIEISCGIVDEIAKGSRNSAGKAGTARAGSALSLKEWMWAYSLGIPVPRSAVETLCNKIEPPPLQLLAKFLDRHFAKKDKNRILKKLKMARDKNDEGGIIATAHQECVAILWSDFQERYKPHAARKRLPSEAAEPCLLLWVLANLDTLLRVIPHEEYGRYPGVLCEKSYTQWYTERADGLSALETSAVEAFDELRKMIKY